VIPRNCIAVVAVIAGLALSQPAFAAGGKGGGGKGKSIQEQTGSTNQSRQRQRLRDGSCTQTGAPQGAKKKSGNTYGPGDGTGNQGQGPKDGTGYGAKTSQ